MITEEQKQKVLKALRDSYANLTAEHTTEKEFENIIESMEIVKNLIIPIVSQRRELLIAFFMHFRNNGEQNIGMTIEQFVDDFLSN